MNLNSFIESENLHTATLDFFQNELQIKINAFDNKPIAIQDFFKGPQKVQNKAVQNIEKLYVVGLVDTDTLNSLNSQIQSVTDATNITEDYQGLIICTVKLVQPPTRTQLAEITRLVNREFPYLPVTIAFKYNNFISLANSERLKFKQEWREGDKIGKVSILRDIDIINTHSGHIRILNDLKLSSKTKAIINNFSLLYSHWQEVFSVSTLNKKFYNELSIWYFWAIKEVQFPNQPLRLDFENDEKFDEALKEHKGKNIIRLLTRILFIWFIKEKGLVPDEIFDEKTIANKFLEDFTPQKPQGIFALGKHNSKYYRAILQNLFFATLNQERGKRGFRTKGKHLNVTQLMRYEDYFKDSKYFIQLMESNVPFMNGGLFECLDKPHETLKGSKGGDRIIYIDGFSDKPDNELMVPDFLFFDSDEEVDVSSDFGQKGTAFKNAKTRGLINILKSYKFTITENTPIDEDIALDPELLGKVFENLLASYNPETKTTARKQTGSFYTPREIVNYMVEESLIAYLKNELLFEAAGVVELGKDQIQLFGNETKTNQLTLETKLDESPFKGKEDELDNQLHQLVGYNNLNPFANEPIILKKIIAALDKCTILDPACGSGAYPMGILQKMVHILHKVDPNNTEWKQRQIDRVNSAIVELEKLDDTDFREKSITELQSQIEDIEASFANNELDYGRKLYLIENCIYGVDIQPIATQISKLRFFISLVVDQKVDALKQNFGIRPLPNLETKFVAANTLVSIQKLIKGSQGSLFDKTEVRKLENELKNIRKKLFSSKIPSQKREFRTKDKELRETISELLVEDFGNDTARLLANWDPYDQNTSSSFFDKEWMFDISSGFDIVIGNPPYVKVQNIPKNQTDYFSKTFESAKGKYDIYVLFIENSIKNLIKKNGVVVFINPHRFMIAEYGEKLRKYLISNKLISKIIVFGVEQVFDSATTYTGIFFFSNNAKSILYCQSENIDLDKITFSNYLFEDIGSVWSFNNESNTSLLKKITSYSSVENLFKGIYQGLISMGDEIQMLEGKIENDYFYGYSKALDKNVKIESAIMKPVLKGENIIRYSKTSTNLFVFYPHYKNNEGKTVPLDEKTLKEKYALAYTYIENFKQKLQLKKVKYKTNEKYWYTLHRSREILLLESEKIITPQLQNYPNFTIDTDNNYPDAGGYMLIKKDSDSTNLKAYLSIFNSKLFYHFIKNTSTPYNNNYYYFKTNYINPFTIPELSIKLQTKLTNHVETIISLKLSKKESCSIEDMIDKLIYKLYNITYQEVLIIDPNFEMSEEEYNNFSLEE